MIYLNKLAPLLFSPLIGLTLLILIGVLLRKRWLALVGLAMLWSVSTPVLADRFFRWIEDDQVRVPAIELPMADAIVVLSGMQIPVAGASGPVAEWGEAVDRVLGGVEAFRAGKARRLIFTAGLLPWQRGIAPEGEGLSRQAIEWGVDPERIRLTRPVENTAQEALVVRDLIVSELGKGPSGVVPHVILVTSAFHMPRAQMLFEAAGLRVTPYPVDFRVSAEGREPTDYFPDTRALHRSNIAIREIIGRAYYRARALFR